MHVEDVLAECVGDDELTEQLRIANRTNEVLEEGLYRQIRVLTDTWGRLQDEQALGWRRLVLRVNIFNAYAGQPTRAPDLDSFTAERVAYSPPSSWTLHIVGSVLENVEQRLTGAPPTNVPFHMPFGMMFSKIVITSPKRVYVWDMKEHMRKFPPNIEGIELHELGDSEEDIHIQFHVNQPTPLYDLSSALGGLLGVTRSSLSQIIKTVLGHIVIHNLLSPDDPQTVLSSPTLQELFGVESFKLNELSSLLETHLKPIPPVEVTHTIRLRGEYGDNEGVYEFAMEWCDVTKQEDRVLPPYGWSDGLSIKKIEDIKNNIYSLENEASRLETELQNHSKRYWQLNQMGTDPIGYLESVMNNEIHSVKCKDFLKDYATSDGSEYYRQPWTVGAVARYLTLKDVPFDDILRRSAACVAIKRL